MSNKVFRLSGYMLLVSTVAAFFVMLFTITSCDNGVVVEEEYPFTIEMLPYYEEVAVGETVEVRCRLVQQAGGEKKDLIHTLRYFPKRGEGEFRIGDSEPLIPNDKYLISAEQDGTFRLYYLPTSSGSHMLLVTAENNMGQSYDFELSIGAEKKAEASAVSVVVVR